MARKSRTKKDKQIDEMATIIENNAKATFEGPKRKTFSSHDLKSIKPLNYAQESLFDSFIQGSNIIAHGSAGTGKTFLALFLALNEVLQKKNGSSKIMIVRSAVSSREIGHLPGDIFEKLAPYEVAYRDIVGELLGKHDAYDVLKSNGVLEFMPTSFVRGLTWDNAIIIIDEIQNMNFHEIHSIITRTGQNSKIIACGDTSQNDLFNKKNDESGMVKFLDVARRSGIFEEIHFNRNDIVRSGLVKKWICALEDVDNKVVNLKIA